MKCICISFLGQKYTWSRFFKLYILIVKLRSILEVDFINLCIYIQLKSILQADFLNRCIYFQTRTYTWSTLSILMYLCSNSEVYTGRRFFKIDVFLFNLRSILEVDFLNLWIYVQTQKYIEVDFLNNLSSNSGVYLKYTSFQKKSWSTYKVLLKYKKVHFHFFSVFILHLYFSLGSSLKAYFYWTLRVWSINDVHLKHKVYFPYSFICMTYSLVIFLAQLAQN